VPWHQGRSKSLQEKLGAYICPKMFTILDLVTDPLHRIEFFPSKFFSKTFKFSIIFYSALQIFGGAHFRKACRSRKNGSKPSEVTCKQSEPARTIFKIEKRREFVRVLCYGQCPNILSKGSTLLRSCWFWSKKLRFQKNLDASFNAVERVSQLDHLYSVTLCLSVEWRGVSGLGGKGIPTFPLFPLTLR